MPQPLRRLLPAALTLLALASLVVLGGCQRQLRPGLLSDASQAYAQGDYARAYQDASQVARQGQPIRSEEAALVAGMAAQQLDRTEDAERYLTQAARSVDRAVSGEALASLGLLYAQEERYEASAEALLRAAERLQGQNRANALYYAGVALQKLGRFAQARTQFTLARGNSSDAAFIQRVSDQLSVVGYTVQLGAFREEENARRLAEEMAAGAAGTQIGAPRVVQSTDEAGRTWYLVQVGQFGTFANAAAARDRLGATQAIIVPLGGSAP